MQDTAREGGTMHSYGPLHMAEQKQGDQLEPTYSSSVRIRGAGSDERLGEEVREGQGHLC